ncbi:transcriptional regulator [Vibrio sp. JCM 19236]|nr:transcriptional regulator [Vibrio sp. JCM 19236]
MAVLPAHMPHRFELHPEDSRWKMVWILLETVPKWDNLISNGQAVLPFQSSEQIWSLMNLLHLEVDGRPSYRRLLISEVSRILLASSLSLLAHPFVCKPCLMKSNHSYI